MVTLFFISSSRLECMHRSRSPVLQQTKNIVVQKPTLHFLLQWSTKRGISAFVSVMC